MTSLESLATKKITSTEVLRIWKPTQTDKNVKVGSGTPHPTLVGPRVGCAAPFGAAQTPSPGIPKSNNDSAKVVMPFMLQEPRTIL
jgi:hypothetical protein